MQKIAEAFIKELKSQGLKEGPVQESDGHTFVHCGVKGKANFYDIVFIFTGEHDAEIAAMRLASCPDDRRAALLPIVNDVNARCRWIKLVVMPDGSVNMRADAIVSEETAGGVCVELFLRMMKVVDDVYPQIMKALCP